MGRFTPPALKSAAMGTSMGVCCETTSDVSQIRLLLSHIPGKTIVFVGDSSLRNQYVALARVMLRVPPTQPFAAAVAYRNYTGSFSAPRALDPKRPDSSNGYWGGVSWMAATTPQDTTVAYGKTWGCRNFAEVLRSLERALTAHGRRHALQRRQWPADALVWNFGLHLLHIYPERPSSSGSLHCALGYEALIAGSVAEARAALPKATLVWRTTNSVCDGRFSNRWSAAARAYHCTPISACGAHEAAIRRKCENRYNVSGDTCDATFMDRQNTRAQRERSLAALRGVAPPEVRVLDAFQHTDDRCELTVDGRHYPLLLGQLNLKLLALLRQLGTKIE